MKEGTENESWQAMKAGRKQAAEIGASRLQAGTGSIEQAAGRNWQQGKQRTWGAEAPARRGWTHRKKQAKQRAKQAELTKKRDRPL